MPGKLLLVVALGALPLAPLSSQQYTPQECAAITASALAHPARTDTLRLVRDCPGVFGSTFATLLQSVAVFADSGTFDTVARMASRRREPEIFSAAIAVAGDTGRPELARLTAVWLLVKYMYGTSFDINLRALGEYEDDGPAICVTAPGTRAVSGENPLPADARAQVHSLATSLMAEQPMGWVPLHAQCLDHISNDALLVFSSSPREQLTFNPSTDFAFQVLCGRRVLLRNASLAPVSIRLVWGDTPAQVSLNQQARDYTLPGRRDGTPYFETTWTVPSQTARKFRIQQVTNPYSAPPYVLLVNLETLNTTACS